MKNCEICGKEINQDCLSHTDPQRLGGITHYTHKECPKEEYKCSICNGKINMADINSIRSSYTVGLDHKECQENQYRPGTGFAMLDEFINAQRFEYNGAIYTTAPHLKDIREALVKDLENEYQAGFCAGFEMVCGNKK